MQQQLQEREVDDVASEGRLNDRNFDPKPLATCRNP
jgi:hypothetical protein